MAKRNVSGGLPELINALASTSVGNEGAKTAAELASELKMGVESVRKWLVAAQADGRVVPVMVRRKTVAGWSAPRPAYKLVK